MTTATAPPTLATITTDGLTATCDRCGILPGYGYADRVALGHGDSHFTERVHGRATAVLGRVDIVRPDGETLMNLSNHPDDD